MNSDVLILITESICVYLLVLWTHALRHKAGLGPFYALLGGITAIMSWITDAGVAVEFAGITFMVGSTVFYTALLLGVFVVYVFDGPHATRVTILTVAGLSIITPIIATVLHLQLKFTGQADIAYVPYPNLRINAASVITTIADLVFLAVAWEFSGRPSIKMRLWLRAFLTLLGVMWLDVLLFATGAFAGTAGYVSIMQGTLLSRFIIAVIASPFLYFYLRWQQNRKDTHIENRPVLAILHEIAETRHELGLAQQEISRRKEAERQKQEIIQRLKRTLARVQKLEGLLPVCSSCKRIRVEPHDSDEKVKWLPLDEYVEEETEAEFSHGVCLDCLRREYPDLSQEVIRELEKPDSSTRESEDS